MLDTRFKRVPGDIGNPDTFPFPVIYRVVEGADVTRVVMQGGDPELATLFIKGGKSLQERGVDLITTSCGFLARFQNDIARVLKVPFISSSLFQLPLLHSLFGHLGPIGIITASKLNLCREHFAGVGAKDIPVRVAGMEACKHFTQAILTEGDDLTASLLKKEVLGVARELLSNNPSIPALILECTNLSPYRKAIRDATRRPVFDITTLIESFALGVTESDS